MSKDADARIAEEAAEWFVEFSDGEPDVTARIEFDRWLRLSPEHTRAYLDMLPIWEDAALPGVGHDLSADELIARARNASSVVQLEDRVAAGSVASAAAAQKADVPAKRNIQRLLLAAAIIFAMLAGAAAWWQSGRTPSYMAGVGEQRSITLSDGSTVQLNSRSRIRVRFSPAERNIDLLEGQALFRVAGNVSRPFIVHSGATDVRAVGTQFDVYRKEGVTTVTVLEGRVAVLPSPEQSDVVNAVSAPATAVSSSPPKTLELTAGEQVTVTANRAALPAAVDVGAATAWTQHELVFTAASLVDVAAEFNRYNARPIVIADPALADFHVTGVFSSSDPTSLLRFLRLQSSLRVQELEDEIRLSRE